MSRKKILHLMMMNMILLYKKLQMNSNKRAVRKKFYIKNNPLKVLGKIVSQKKEV